MRWIAALLSMLPASSSLMEVPVVRDAVTVPYYEDAFVPRPVAQIAVELVASGEGAFLRVVVAALGPDVDPLPGIAGAPGANLRTAEELERLLREQTLQLVARVGADQVPGRLVEIEWARVPQRRIGEDGLVDFAAMTESPWPVRAVFESEVLPAGETWCYLQADGVPRLAVHASPQHILAVESRGEREAVR
ncbi:MAG: hypothetical protein ABIP94_17630 [Planctomycetota bacterium]